MNMSCILNMQSAWHLNINYTVAFGVLGHYHAYVFASNSLHMLLSTAIINYNN